MDGGVGGVNGYRAPSSHCAGVATALRFVSDTEQKSVVSFSL